MRIPSLVFVLALFLIGSRGAEASAPRTNELRSMALHVSGAETHLEIEGSLPPTFTTSHEEGRLIVDIFRARLAPSVERRMAKGAVRSVQSEARASDVRVVVGFESGREAMIEATELRLRIRIVPGPEARPLLAQPASPPEGARITADAARAAAAEEARVAEDAARVAAGAEMARVAEEAARISAAAEAARIAEEAARAAAAVEEARIAEEAARVAAAVEETRVAEEAARAVAAAEEARIAEEAARVAAAVEETWVAEEGARAASAAEEARIAEEAARVAAAAEEARIAEEGARAAAAAEEARIAEEDARAAAVAEEARVAEEGARAAAAAEEARVAEEGARAAAAPSLGALAPIAAATGAAAATAHSPASKRSAAPIDISYVGFRQSPDSVQVTVHHEAPASYRIAEVGGKLVLELENSRISTVNGRRSIDASFFGTSVGLIRPVEDRAAGSVRVEIGLRRSQPRYSVRQSDDELVIEFAH